MAYKPKVISRDEEWKRSTITIPRELVPFVEKQTAHPQHSGNLSSYVRSLIIRDRETASTRKQAA